MANVTATTGIDNFTGTGPSNGSNNTSSSADVILFTNQNQLQPGDRLDGGAGTDTLSLDTSIDFTIAGTSGTNTGLRNLEIIRFNGAFTATFRSDQFGAGLLSDTLTLRGTDNATQTIVINMVPAATTLNMIGWQFNTWTGGTDVISVNGSAGDDTIFVSSQHTRFDGGAGSDTIDYSNWSGTFTLTLNGSTWVNATWGSGVYDTLRNVENVVGSLGNDTITGDGLDNRLSGAAGNDILDGAGGNDTLDGGTGADTMTGGTGSDTFYVDDAGDVVIERASNPGIDLVYSSVTFSAAGTNQDGIENITLTATAAINATGNALANVLTGNSAANVLAGNAGHDQLFGHGGNDTLNGGDGNDLLDGGTGADTLTGGTGNDTFYVDDAGDVVIDRTTDAGTDLVYSSVTFSAAGTNQDGIENITLTGTGAINATGNDLNNVLTGNSAANVLIGGLSADVLYGDAGNDLFIAVAADLVAGEVIDGGADTDTLRIDGGGVATLAGVTLANVESIVLTDTTGTRLSVTSEAQANLITSAAGTSDTIVIQGLDFWAQSFAPLTTTLKHLFDAGVETVEWVEGGGTNTATRDAATGEVTVTGTDTTGQTWTTSVLVFEADGNRRSFDVAFDDGHTSKFTFANDLPTQYKVENLPDSVATGHMKSITDTYDSVGRIDTHEVVHYDGLTLRSHYDDAGVRTSYDLEQADTAGTYGWTINNQTFTDAGVLLSQHVIATGGNVIDRSYVGGLITQETITDGGANESWDTITTTYIGGAFDTQTFLYDDGSAFTQGTAGANTVMGVAGGLDVLAGRDGNDTFVFAQGFGHDIITDFADGDQLDLTAFGVTDLASLDAAADVYQAGGDVMIDIGVNKIQLLGFNLASLGNDDLFNGIA